MKLYPRQSETFKKSLVYFYNIPFVKDHTCPSILWGSPNTFFLLCYHRNTKVFQMPWSIRIRKFYLIFSLKFSACLFFVFFISKYSGIEKLINWSISISSQCKMIPLLSIDISLLRVMEEKNYTTELEVMVMTRIEANGDNGQEG